MYLFENNTIKNIAFTPNLPYHTTNNGNPDECVSATIGLSGRFIKTAEERSIYNINIIKYLCIHLDLGKKGICSVTLRAKLQRTNRARTEKQVI
jgi:hypothetical protein